MLLTFSIKTAGPDPEAKSFERILSLNSGKGYIKTKVPASIGKGCFTYVEIAREFQVTCQFYRLNVPLQVTKTPVGNHSDTISIVFYDLQLPGAAYIAGNRIVFEQSGISMYTNDNHTDLNLEFPAGTERKVVSVHIGRTLLESMLGAGNREFLNQLLQNRKSFFIHEQLSGEMRALITALNRPPSAKALGRFFYHTRSLQLIYCLLEQLNKRTQVPARNINSANIHKIFQVRTQLTSDLSTPPVISKLAKTALMSESHLKQIFREVFGESIYQYYQQQRLEKARQLLQENKKTVREIGFELGFTNIGHFSRLFKRTYHIKPKKFQMEA